MLPQRPQQRPEACGGVLPTKDTLITILKEFGPTGVIFGAIGPVTMFLKDITTSAVEIPFEAVKSRAHSVSNKLSVLMAASGLLDAAIGIVDNYQTRQEKQRTQGTTYKFTTSGRIALALEGASGASSIFAIQRSGVPGAELQTIAGAFTAGALGKVARVFRDRDTKAVRNGTAPVSFQFQPAQARPFLAPGQASASAPTPAEGEAPPYFQMPGNPAEAKSPRAGRP